MDQLCDGSGLQPEHQKYDEVRFPQRNTGVGAKVNSGAFLINSASHDGCSCHVVDNIYDVGFDMEDIGDLGDDEDPENYLQCYVDYVGNGGYEPVFPFHAPCYYVLQRRLSSSASGLATVDKDVLYSVMRALTDHSDLKINYGSPNPVHEQYWDSNPGEEIFVANPGLVEGLEERIRGMMADGYFALSHGIELDLNHGVLQDPFMGLPVDILLNIAGQIEDPTSFLNWAKASWLVHTFLRGSQDSFWRRVIRTQMGWFFELLPCLDDNALCDGSSMRAIFLWAACGSEPRRSIKGGYFLRIANRHRIWTTPCAELADQYCSKLSPHILAASSEDSILNFRDILRSKASCNHMYVVTHNNQARLYSEIRKCFWVDEWEETYTKTQVVEAFFMRSNGFLAGIALTTEGGKRQLLGSTDETPLSFEAIIPAEDWICGMLLHIPSVEFVGRPVGDVGETSPKGITVGHQATLPEQLANTSHSRSSVSLDVRFTLVRQTEDILCEHCWLVLVVRLLGWWPKWLYVRAPRSNIPIRFPCIDRNEGG